jgi:hypothetical protein
MSRFPQSIPNRRAYRGRLEGMIEGGDVAGECDAGSPGSGGASPYLRRGRPVTAIHGQDLHFCERGKRVSFASPNPFAKILQLFR